MLFINHSLVRVTLIQYIGGLRAVRLCYLQLFVLAVLFFSAAESDGLDGSDNSYGIG